MYTHCFKFVRDYYRFIYGFRFDVGPWYPWFLLYFGKFANLKILAFDIYRKLKSKLLDLLFRIPRFGKRTFHRWRKICKKRENSRLGKNRRKWKKKRNRWEERGANVREMREKKEQRFSRGKRRARLTSIIDGKKKEKKNRRVKFSREIFQTNFYVQLSSITTQAQDYC